MKKMKTIFLAYKEMHRLEKRLTPISIVVAIVMAVMPFVNIWFTSKIIDLLDTGAQMKELFLYIGLAVGINFALFFFNYFLGDMYYMYRSLMYNKELQNISSKLYKIEYQKLEDSSFKELVHKHSEAQDRVFSSFTQFSWMLRDFLSGLITLIISVIIIIPLFKIGFTKTGNTYFEKPIFLLTIFAAIAVMVVIILIVALRMNKMWFKASDEYSRLDRIFYYFINMFSDYKTGKEIRLYKEQNLIEHAATDKILTDGEKVLRKVSLNSAKSSSFVAILGAIVGFGIYLFIGVKGLYGLFGIGSLVLYCGSFMQIINGIMKMAATFGKTEEMAPLVNYYFEIMNSEDEIQFGNEELDNSKFEIEFRNVSFKYPNADTYSLRNINIKIKNGEHLAVVGRNGSGKTTFIKLMCRLY
ncbi:MAG: ABC transporter ATP-binding protein/permease, partial [Eubacterium sp.]|nr:ABC transporter ATP-binding protein/permease [Eubacterium sp.]